MDGITAAGIFDIDTINVFRLEVGLALAVRNIVTVGADIGLE